MQRTTRTILSVLLALSTLTGGAAFAQKKKKAPVKPPITKPTTVKGQGQMIGGIGRFGETYTLKNSFNFTLLGAHYTMEPIGDYGEIYPDPDQKLVVLDFALKNVDTRDNWYSSDGFFTLVDSKGGLYTGSGGPTLKSGGRNTNTTLRPGQGIGQPGLNDPLRIAFPVPADARIVKIMVNSPRANITEEVFRYYIAGATKAEAGENGDPKNVITPLPDTVRDTSDASGAVALPAGKGVIGAATSDCVSYLTHFRVNSVTLSSENLNGNPPDEGKQWAIATITASFPLYSGKAADFKEIGSFDFPGGGGGFAELTDADGETYSPAEGLRKPTKDEAIADNRTLKVGDEYTYRIYFAVPKDVKLKTLTIGASKSRKWAFDIK